MGASATSQTFTGVCNIGYIPYNQQVTFSWDATGIRYLNGSNNPTVGGENRTMTTRWNYIRIKRDNTIIVTFTNSNLQMSYNFITPVAGNYSVEKSWYYTPQSGASYGNPIAYQQVYVQSKIPRTGVHTLIGYDGIATSFGNGRYLYFGPNET